MVDCVYVSYAKKAGRHRRLRLRRTNLRPGVRERRLPAWLKYDFTCVLCQRRNYLKVVNTTARSMDRRTLCAQPRYLPARDRVHPRALEHRRQTPCRGCRAPVDLVAIVVFGLSLSRAPWWVGGLLAAIGAVDWLLLTLSQAAYSLLWRPLALLGWLLPALWVGGTARRRHARRHRRPRRRRRRRAATRLSAGAPPPRPRFRAAHLSGPGALARSTYLLVPRGRPRHAARRRAQHPRLRPLFDAATVK